MNAAVKLVGRPGRPRKTVPTVTIEKGIPIPIAPEPIEFPFADMEVGDSFYVPCATERVSMQGRLRARFRYWLMKQCPRPNVRITTHRVDGGLRCWRIE